MDVRGAGIGSALAEVLFIIYYNGNQNTLLTAFPRDGKGGRQGFKTF